MNLPSISLHPTVGQVYDVLAKRDSFFEKTVKGLHRNPCPKSKRDKIIQDMEWNPDTWGVLGGTKMGYVCRNQTLMALKV